MEGRTTRSKRKLIDNKSTSTAELYLEGPPSKQLYLSDSVVLTPPPSQHPPTPPSYTTRRRRQELETNGFLHKQPRYVHPSSLDQSSSSSDPSLHSSFHQDEMNLVFPGFDISSLVYNDTLLYKACPDDNGDEEIAGPSSDLHTPPGSPTLNSVDVPTPMCPRPETPIPRPETPGDISPLTPSACTDEVFESSSLVGHSLSTYGPPPTPMCPPRNKKSNFVRDGNIKSMRLQNFMSHREFYVEWNPNVNIINGPNGSGKSTIQTAFLLVFGAKAVTTQRTSTVRKLIKKGCTDAQIEVCLGCENGSLSKKKYGKEISLALKIKSNGACIRTVGIPNGKRRKIKVPELTFICHALQIDPNNPVQFLKQERGSEASNVSANKKVGSERFTKFKQATQLQAKEEMVQISQENVKATMEFIQMKEKDRKNLALLEQQLRKEKEQIQKLEQTKTKIPELENECAWSLVKILEDDHKHVRTKKEETVLTIKEFKDVKKTRETEIANFHLKEEQNKKEYSITKKLADTKNFEVDAKESELRERKRTQVRVQTEHNVLQREVRNLSKEITILEGKKNEETINYQEQNQKAYMEIERLMALCKGHQKRLSEERLNRDTIDDELKEFKARIHTGNENIKKYNSQLNQTTKELNKRVNMGSNMNELIQKVTRYTGWTITPVGPLGAHITVPDHNARFAPLLEHILQIALYTFVVQCKEDFSKLTSFIKEIYERKDKNKSREREPTVVLISSLNQNEYMSKLGKVKNKLHQLHFRTVLSMLTIKDRIVEIGLIERTNCERVIVFERNHDAAQIMKNPARIPPEVKLAYTLEWFKVTAYPRFQFQVISQVKYHTDIIPMAKVEAAIHIKEEIAREQEVIDTCLIRVKGPSEPGGRPPLERQLKDSDERILLTNKEIHQLNNKVHQLQLCIKEVPSHAQEEKDAAKEIKAVMEMRAEREKTIQIKMHELELVKEEISRIHREKEMIENQIPPLQQRLEELETQQNDGSALKLENEVENLRIKIERHEREFHQLSHQDQKIWDEIERTMKSAPSIRPEVLNRKPEQVKRDIEDLKALLEKSSEKLKKKKRVISEHKNSLELLKKISDEIDILTKLYNLLEPFVKSNVDYYEKMKRGTGILLKANFQLLVEADGLTGGLVIDWEKETIVFYVSPDQQSEARARKNYCKQDGEMVIADKQGIYNYYNSLSGGERSKALVFFIMAMWKITDLPFHCLDEFEACLDDQSRIGIHEKLINHARNHSDAQFFIFTPLDLDGIPRDDPFITIHKLRLARR